MSKLKLTFEVELPREVIVPDEGEEESLRDHYGGDIAAMTRASWEMMGTELLDYANGIELVEVKQ